LLGTVEPLGVVVLLGVELFGLTLLPGSHGLAVATVVDVPLGREAEVVLPVVELVELPAPLFAVAEVLPVEGVLLAVVDVPVLPLLEGVHGAAVVEVPVCVCVVPCVPPVTDPALPATPGVP
jgi:hypothetical protein